MPTDKKQINIVDDDESVCRALKCLLMTFGFEVTTFLSGEQYLSEARDDFKGCLILDIHMPGLDGWEVLRRCIKSGTKRPIIIISAEKNSELKKQAIKLGAVGFFQKPVNAQELVDLINRSY